VRVSLKWLRDYVDVSLPAQELAEKLTMAGLEVGAIETLSRDWENVFVGQVTALDKHPNAERLMLATVDLGPERLTVISGAPNLRVGDKVPLARAGARLIDAHTDNLVVLKPAKIRGITSQGMACSEKELGISDDHTGIMILPQDAPIGLPLSQYLGDAIFDIKVTPNRPDCLSMLGIAQEVAALTGQTMRSPEVSYQEQGSAIEQMVAVEIAEPELCPRYCAGLVTDVRIEPSPSWMQQRLLAAGMRPINNVVDITNYVLLEYGQPLHAFDCHKLEGSRIIVRRARDGESITTIDEVERVLDGDMLVIADGQDAVAIAGVMGGAGSEVSEETSYILLESANFKGTSVRRTSTELRLRTEASLRFEKGLSTELPPLALDRAIQLMTQLSGGKAAKGIIDLYPGKREREPILLSKSRVDKVLGMKLSIERITEVLSWLGFSCEPLSPSELLVTVPYWRTDISMIDDLAEEVARIIGYDEFPIVMPSGELPRPEPAPILSLKEKIGDILIGCGLQEVITYSLTSREMLEKVDPGWQLGHPLLIANPLTEEQECLRTTLRANLLATLAANEKRWEGGIRLFEIGRIYLPRENDLPEEHEMLAAVLSGPREEQSWLKGEGMLDFFDAKGTLGTLFTRLGVDVRFEPAEAPILLPGRTARIAISDEIIGLVGELHPKVAKSFDISAQPVCLFEVDINKLAPFTTQALHYRPLPRFPSTVRDIALVVDSELPAKRVQEVIQSFPLISQATLFDLYRGEQVPPGKKSLAFSIRYQSPTQTLTDEEVNKTQKELLDRLKQELGATLRG
jgi:phenylalanyl-tRNA synthetase beta chain